MLGINSSLSQQLPEGCVFGFKTAFPGIQGLVIPHGGDHDETVRGMIRAKAYLGLEFTSVLTSCEKFKSYAHHSRLGVAHESVKMTSMSATEPRRQKHTLGFSDQLVWQVTQQRLYSPVGEENVAGQINDYDGIRTRLVEPAQRGLTHLPDLAQRIYK